MFRADKYTLKRQGDKYIARIEGDYIYNIEGYTGAVTLGDGLKIDENGKLSVTENEMLEISSEPQTNPITNEEIHAYENLLPINYTGVIFTPMYNDGETIMYIGHAISLDHIITGIIKYSLTTHDIYEYTWY